MGLTNCVFYISELVTNYFVDFFKAIFFSIVCGSHWTLKDPHCVFEDAGLDRWVKSIEKQSYLVEHSKIYKYFFQLESQQLVIS
jgi:hypothetical protein